MKRYYILEQKVTLKGGSGWKLLLKVWKNGYHESNFNLYNDRIYKP